MTLLPFGARVLVVEPPGVTDRPLILPANARVQTLLVGIVQEPPPGEPPAPFGGLERGDVVHFTSARQVGDAMVVDLADVVAVEKDDGR